MINVKTFSDKDNSNKKVHHVNLFGLKFRSATKKRLSKVDGRNIYRTSRGIVFNFLKNRYLCLITKR